MGAAHEWKTNPRGRVTHGSTITWSTDAPGGAIGLIVNEDGRDILVQTDWDCPGIAGTFGWSTRDVQKRGQRCEHDSTDGTVDCETCGVTASEFIAAACEWLRDNDGATAEDPGYFDEERNNPRFREGDVIIFDPNPAARMFYTGTRHAEPQSGERGVVTSLPTGSGRSTQMPGPRGGMVYADWENAGTIGVFANDVRRATKAERAGRSNPGERLRPHALTYGTMPNLHEFVAVTETDEDGEPNYPFGMNLNSRDEDVAVEAMQKAGISRRTESRRSRFNYEIRDAEDMWEFINALHEIGEESEGIDNDANNLASSLMSVLGYEWI